ncbi:glycosyltransferase family 2 protein [Celeribacter indicus]|uniref:Glycosyl transferase group 2 family protein n=1 Tax=Celeribacter indicus TaxID=1208324 RepID=A0A0B5E325_9RHOB|nr:glycosyltransferase family 2 protein [Celeribacter indicus]AJE47790.1 glycosyl transferase group 2 family protein [Celeribacter indicus]SDW22990.1 succinoglycan biosynthesis protein ExoU [Celeribacter indicus]
MAPITPAAPAAAIDVSVLIAAYDGAATLERAVASVLGQVGLCAEAIVIDDASRDTTHALALRLAAESPDRVRALTTGVNGGPSKARNLGLRSARGTFVTVLDCDDYMEPGRLARLLAHARETGADFVADDLFKVVEGAERGPRDRLLGLPREGETVLAVDLAEFTRGNMTTYNGARGEMGFLKPLMRRDFLERHGLRYHEDMRLGEDFALYAEALLAGARFDIVPPAGYVAVVRPGSLSGSHGTAELAALAARIGALRRAGGCRGGARAAMDALWLDTMKRYSWARLIDAVKARNLREAAACFAAPPAVGAHLAACLWEQVLVRGRARLAGARA